jgi:hypothetical protein
MNKKVSLMLTGFLILSLAPLANAATKKNTQNTDTDTTATHAAAPAKRWSRPYGMAGCGWGSQVMGKRGGQVSAATTNDLGYNQFFAISAGSSNCEDDPNAEVAHNMDIFVAANRSALADDIARGGGETLSTLSQLMGCRGSDGALSTALQKNFRDIYPNEKVTPNEVSDAIVSVIMSEGPLAGSCNVVL